MEIKKSGLAIVGAIGLVLAVAGLVVYLIWGEPVWLYTTLEVLALIHLVAFFVTHFELLKDFSGRRSTQFGANSFLMIALFIAILAILNFISVRHHARIDFSGAGTYTLAPQTVSVLQGLKKEVKISGFFPQGSAVKDKAEDLFKTYRHTSPRIQYETIDPDKQPALAKQHGITEYDTVVMVSGGESALIKTISEQEVTSALIRISRGTKNHLYFVEGHGEHALEDVDRNGYSFLKQALEGQGFAVSRLVLLSEKEVPADASVVVVGGPQRPLIQEEQAALDRYLTSGGRLVFLTDPLVKSEVEPFLSRWGIQLQDDLILDPTSTLGGVVPVVGPGSYPSHDLTREFKLATFYPLSRSVTFSSSQEAIFMFEPLLQSGPGSWLTSKVTGELSIDPDRDKKGPILFGGVIRHKEGEALSAAQKRMRLVVVGDSDFGTNSVVRAAGNGDLFQNMMSWLAEEKDLISIRPQEAGNTTLLLSTQQIRLIFFSSVVMVPSAMLIAGLTVWRRRRRL